MILVTGGTGIVGARLLYDLYSQNAPVRAMRRVDSDLTLLTRAFRHWSKNGARIDHTAIKWVEGDLLDIDSLDRALEGVEQVYHAAALVSYRPQDYDALIRSNATGTANLVNACLSAQVRKFCHISSVAALGMAEDQEMVTENTHWTRDQNRSNYGLSKFMAEREVWRGSAEGLDVVILNPSVILGPSLPDRSSGMLLQTLRRGIGYYPGGAAGFVDVRDVSAAAIGLMQSSIVNERYVINGANLRFQELLELSARVFGNRPPVRRIPNWALSLSWMGAALGAKISGKPAIITRESAENAMRSSRYDSSKLQAALSMEFTSISAAIEDYREFVRSEA